MNQISDIPAALSEEIRLRIVMLLWGAKLCVKCLVKATQSPQPTISRHLSVLRKSGIVMCERDGLHLYYMLDFSDDLGPLKQKVISAFHDHLMKKKPYRSDRSILKKMASECDASCVIPLRLHNNKGNSK